MGSTMRPTIFDERVAMALKNWHHKAKKHVKENRGPATVVPVLGRPMSPRSHIRSSSSGTFTSAQFFTPATSQFFTSTASHHPIEMGSVARDRVVQVHDSASVLAGSGSVSTRPSAPSPREIDIRIGHTRH